VRLQDLYAGIGARCLSSFFNRMDDVNELQEALELSLQQKHDLEVQAAEQAKTVTQLQEANETLSTRALTLAADAVEAGSKPDAARKEMEAMVTKLKAELSEAREELDRIHSAESDQHMCVSFSLKDYLG